MPVDLFEVATENYAYSRGARRERLLAVRERYPVHLHGLSLNLASFDPFDDRGLRGLRELVADTAPMLVSDHLCWTRLDGRSHFDLLPFPFTRAMLGHLAERIDEAQDRLGIRLAFENVSTYFRFRDDEMTEPEFLAELLERTGAKLLLDVNNLYVNSVNHGLDARAFVDALPAGSVAGYHLAGHRAMEGGWLFDTHDAPVPETVWELYRRAVARFGHRPAFIERDGDLPGVDELVAEAARAKAPDGVAG